MVTAISREKVRSLFEEFLAAREPKTRSCYRTDFAALAVFLHSDDKVSAIHQLLVAGDRAANLLVKQYRADLLRQDAMPATVNRRLAAVRSFVRCARAAGLIRWRITIENITPPQYRTTPVAKWRKQ